MMKLPLFFSVIGALVSISAAAEVATPKSASPEERLKLATPRLPQHETVEESTSKENTLSITKEELVKRPDLIIRGLIPALLQNNVDAVALLFPLYRQQQPAQQDPFLLAWGEAMMATHQGDYASAVQQYRELFAKRPDILQLRYQLAHALFLNNDNEAAKDQFQKLRAEVNDTSSQQMIDQYLTAINQRDQWKINGGISFLNESNINNAPKAGTRIGAWKAWEREQAHGLSYNVGAEKKWSLPNQFFAKLVLDGQGKYYWDNKKYNEFNARIGAGLGYVTHWLNKSWQISTALEYGEQRYATRKHLNGNNYLWSNTLLFLPYSGQYWYIGADYNRENTRDLDNAYQRKNVRLGWVQEWPLGISSRLSVTYARRAYKGEDLLGIRQKNKEYQTNVTLWHRNVYFWGITPKITWSYQKNDSNHPFYRYDKNRIYLEMSKTF